MSTQPFGQTYQMIERCSEYLSIQCIWLYVLVMSRTHFQSESKLSSCLIVKELLGRSWREIWRSSDSNWTRTQNHLVLKRTLNHLAKWLSVLLRTKWFCVRVQLQSLRFIHSHLFIHSHKGGLTIGIMIKPPWVAFYLKSGREELYSIYLTYFNGIGFG